MQIALVILIVALIAKDITFLGDPYVMRGGAQALCLIMGGLWITQHSSMDLLKRYWIIIAYLLILAVATFGTRDPVYVALQVISLAAIVMFGIAYFESRQHVPLARRTNETLIMTTVFMYGVIAWLSLVAAKYWPSIAYLDVNAGNIAGIQVRFRGVFSQPGNLGAAVGLLVVLSLFGSSNVFYKLVLGSSGVICLALTSSRTFWVASIVAVGLTRWSYFRKGRVWIVTVTAAGLFAMATVAALDIQLDTKALGNVIRIESVSNLAGRVSLWERAIKAFEAQPYLGYGFTAGSVGLEEEGRSGAIGGSPGLSFRDMGRSTMHSGYVQSLLDSGLIGTFFYVTVIVFSIRSFYRYDESKTFPAEFAALIFLSIANLSENVIYSASVFSSVLFWLLAIFAFSLEGATKVSKPGRKAGIPRRTPSLTQAFPFDGLK